MLICSISPTGLHVVMFDVMVGRVVIRCVGGIWVMGALALGCGPDTTEVGADTSSTSDDTTTGDPPQGSVLEQCDAPAPCDPISRDPGSNNEEVSQPLECAIDQVFAAVTEGDVAELSASYCDIGCVGTDLLLAGGSIVYLQTWSTTDVTSYEEVQQCTLKSATFFEPCQGQPWGTNGCMNFNDWVTDCEVIETVSCP